MLVQKQLVGGPLPKERQLAWVLDNFRFRASQSVNLIRTGEWNVAEFQEWGRKELKGKLYVIAGIGAERKLTRKELYQIRVVLKEQIRYWDRFASDIVGKMKALAESGLTGPELIEAREKMLRGIERRAHFYLGAIEAEGRKWDMAARFEDGQWFRWDMNPELENCETCIGRDGEIHQMRGGRLPFYPKDGDTICIFNCGCEWTPVLGPPSGKRKRLGPMGARRRGKKLAEARV